MSELAGGGELAVEVREGSEVVGHLLGADTVQRLSPVEALYLLYKHQDSFSVFDEEGNELDFVRFASIVSKVDPHLWSVFEVYLDLRRRGRVAVAGPRRYTLLVKRRKTDKRYTFYILALEEGRPIKIDLLDAFTEEAQKNKWIPVVAIVDRYGDVTYYEVSRFRLEPVQRSER
ncbi:MAG: hypothetical protein ABWW70_07905 [Thermoproteota archaeon]